MSRDRKHELIEMAQPGRKWGYAAVLAACLILGLAAVGWQWRSDVVLKSIEVVSACEVEWKLFSSAACPPLNATEDEIREMVVAELDERLYEMDLARIADQAQRHPWIEHVDVERTPSGEMILTVAERTPVLLAMRSGRPVHYIDAQGFRMPFVAGVAYDVPLLHGLDETFDPLDAVAEPSVLELASVLDDLDPSIHALVSEIEIRKAGEFVLHTTVLDGRGSLEVRIGKGEIEKQLTKLHAFWHQALLPEPERDIRQIDLRFNSQIVTK